MTTINSTSQTEIKWATLTIPIPDSVITMTDEKTQESIFAYLSQLDKIQQQTYVIAFHHLKTSFNIIRSTGYNEWLKTAK